MKERSLQKGEFSEQPTITSAILKIRIDKHLFGAYHVALLLSYLSSCVTGI